MLLLHEVWNLVVRICTDLYEIAKDEDKFSSRINMHPPTTCFFKGGFDVATHTMWNEKEKYEKRKNLGTLEWLRKVSLDQLSLRITQLSLFFVGKLSSLSSNCLYWKCRFTDARQKPCPLLSQLVVLSFSWLSPPPFGVPQEIRLPSGVTRANTITARAILMLGYPPGPICVDLPWQMCWEKD